jgi:hypothetical protein
MPKATAEGQLNQLYIVETGNHGMQNNLQLLT